MTTIIPSTPIVANEGAIATLRKRAGRLPRCQSFLWTKVGTDSVGRMDRPGALSSGKRAGTGWNWQISVGHQDHAPGLGALRGRHLALAA